MKRQLSIVELVGPAGAGKTTIRNALINSDARIRFGVVPQIRDIRNMPFLLWNTVLLLPVFFAIFRAKEQQFLSLPLIIRLAVLNGWSKKLNTLDETHTSVLILDQGPVYMLAELLRHGPSKFRCFVPRWWEQVCRNWSNAIDLIICLDTPDDILMQRIRNRAKKHGIKQNADEWATQFLAESRAAQNEVLTSMTQEPGSVSVIRIDTSQFSVNESIQRISDLISQKRK
jgi:broad-specificity NMP kinase